MTAFLVSCGNVAHPHSAKVLVPENKERLGEVCFDTPALVMDVVVLGIVRKQALERVEGEFVAAVVIDGLDGRACEKPHGLSDSHASYQIGEPSSESVEQKSFKGVVVQCAVSIGHV